MKRLILAALVVAGVAAPAGAHPAPFSYVDLRLDEQEELSDLPLTPREGWVSVIALAVMMLRGPDLVALTAEQLAGTPLEEAAQVFTTIGNLIPTLVLTIVIIVSSIEVAQMVYHLLKSRPSTPYPVIK